MEEKADLIAIHSVYNREKALKALEQAKAMERNYKGEIFTMKLPNGTEIKSSSEHHLNEIINSYGKL